MKWADVIHANKKRLSFLGTLLKTKDRSVSEVFEQDYPDVDFSGIISELAAVS